jgi:hypothetical protein
MKSNFWIWSNPILDFSHTISTLKCIELKIFEYNIKIDKISASIPFNKPKGHECATYEFHLVDEKWKFMKFHPWMMMLSI